MSAEHQPDRHESLDGLSSGEQLKSPERHETSAESLEANRHEQAEQLETARAALEQQPEPAAAKAEHSEPKHHPTRIDKEAAYWDTLRSVQRHLTPAARTFSRVIHNPAVEKTSEIVGQTVARPSVLLGATTTAALLGSFFYITARIYGFSLSGSEFVLSLLVGGVLGIVVEGLGKIFFKPRT